MPMIFQTLAGAVDFAGGVGSGLFTFDQFQNIPRTSRIALATLGYKSEVGDATTEVSFYATFVGAAPSERILLARGVAPTIVAPDTSVEVTFCGRVLPRTHASTGEQWRILAFTTGKSVTGTMFVDYIVTPFPNTNPADSSI